MKKHFMTGLAILLPMVITLIIASFIINFLTKPFTGLVQHMLDRYGLLDTPFWIFTGSEMLFFSSKIVVLILIVFLTILIGFVGQLVLVKFFLRLGDWIIHRIPLVNKIYKAIQDTLHTLFDSKKIANFSQVVLVPFPYKNSLCLGLIISEIPEKSDEKYGEYISVFVPGTPNPTMAFVLLFKKDQLIPIDMKVEEAFKFIVSCGSMVENFKKLEKQT